MHLAGALYCVHQRTFVIGVHVMKLEIVVLRRIAGARDQIVESLGTVNLRLPVPEKIYVGP